MNSNHQYHAGYPEAKPNTALDEPVESLLNRRARNRHRRRSRNAPSVSPDDAEPYASERPTYLGDCVHTKAFFFISESSLNDLRSSDERPRDLAPSQLAPTSILSL